MRQTMKITTSAARPPMMIRRVRMREPSTVEPWNLNALKVLLDFSTRQPQHYRAAVRAHARVRGAPQLFENEPHLLHRERVVRLHRGVARHRRRNPPKRVVGDSALA